jgi:glutaminase
MSKATVFIALVLASAGLTGAAAIHKPPQWRHKCERPFSFDELTKMIEARETEGWELITVAPVVMTAQTQDVNAYMRYVACFKRPAES